METLKTNIIADVKLLLDNYMSKTDVREFINAIENTNKLEMIIPDINEIDKSHVDFIIPQGTDQRILVDRIITLTEKLMTQEKFYHLLLDLSQLMFTNGEIDFSLEVADELRNRVVLVAKYKKILAEVSLMISKIYWSQAQWDECEYFIKDAYEAYKSISNENGYAKCENMYGTLFGEKGEFKTARTHFEKALSFLKDDEDLSTQAMLLTNLGVIYTVSGNYEKAIWNLKNAAERFEKLNDQNRFARVLHNMGMLYTRMGKYDEALEEFNKCITISLGTHYFSTCAIAYIGKAYIYNKLKNQQLSEAFTDKALEIAYKINDTLSIADIYKIKGMISNDLENFELSEEFFENSLRLNKDFENKLNSSECSAEMGKLLERLDRHEEAKTLVQSALDYFRELSDQRHISGLVEIPI